MSASAIYEGTISHRRYAVRAHELRHRLALFYLDLEELPTLLGGRLCRSRPGLVRYRRSDYLGDPGSELAHAVRQCVRERTGATPTGPIRLLTQLRTFGHCFNPVSFYYCFDAHEQLAALLAEVTNTPWGERYAYVLERTGAGPVLAGELTKQLHVSPFMAMAQSYQWSASDPGERLAVHIASTEHGQLVFEATLALRRAPLTRASLTRIGARYPAASLRVLALIYGHALALKLKGVPVHRRAQLQL
jgi:DUF1365 family protein